ncbi:uncharacterized protein M421DRAFT_77103, partial [Didymella exigua CBS 183.55]
LNSKLVVSLAVVRDIKNLVIRYTRLLVLGREVVLAREDNKGWDRPALRADALDNTNALDNGNPLAITWLNKLWLSMSL